MFKLYLSLNLLFVPIVGTASEWSPSRILQSGEKAPFTGILLPEPTYRLYQGQIDKLPILEDGLNKCYSELDEERSSWPYFLLFFAGAALGYVGHSR